MTDKNDLLREIHLTQEKFLNAAILIANAMGMVFIMNIFSRQWIYGGIVLSAFIIATFFFVWSTLILFQSFINAEILLNILSVAAPNLKEAQKFKNKVWRRHLTGLNITMLGILLVGSGIIMMGIVRWHIG